MNFLSNQFAFNFFQFDSRLADRFAVFVVNKPTMVGDNDHHTTQQQMDREKLKEIPITRDFIEKQVTKTKTLNLIADNLQRKSLFVVVKWMVLHSFI